MDVTVVGACNVDLISYAPRQPKPGETLIGNKFEKGFGGKGANQCVMAARLGAKAVMISKVGDDTFGKEYYEHFKKLKVDTDHLGVVSEASTGVATILVSEDGQNSIVVIPGTNDLITEADVKDAESWIQHSKVVLCQMEIPLQPTLTALRLAKKHGVRSIYNSAPAQADLPVEFFSVCDIFCANETETEILTGLAVSTIKGAKTASLALLDKGCNSVILTLGPLGSVFVSSSDRNPQVIPCPKVTAVDTTGAGDCFLGSLAYYLAMRPDLEMREAISRAGRVASISVQARGTQISYPWREDLPADLFD